MKIKLVAIIILISYCLFFCIKSFAEMECPDSRSNFILELMPTKDSYLEGDFIGIKLRWTNVSEREVVVERGDFGPADFSVVGEVDEKSFCPVAYLPHYPIKGQGAVKPGEFIENEEMLPVNCSGCEPLKPGKYLVTIAISYNKCYAQPVMPVEIKVVSKNQQGFWPWLMRKFNMKGR